MRHQLAGGGEFSLAAIALQRVRRRLAALIPVEERDVVRETKAGDGLLGQRAAAQQSVLSLIEFVREPLAFRRGVVDVDLARGLSGNLKISGRELYRDIGGVFVNRC